MKSSVFRAIIKKYAKILIAMLLVSSLGCGLMSGMANGFLSLKTTLDDYVKVMKYPDGVVETTVMTRDNLDKAASLAGVEIADARLEGNLVLLGKEGVYYSMQARTYSDDEFQGIHYWETTDKESEYPVLIERRFSRLNDIHAGDTLEIRFQDRTWNGLVAGVITRPEMLGRHRFGDVQMFSTDIGFVYIADDVMEKISDPDYDAASSEWEKNNQDYTQKKEEAEEDYKKITGEIDEAEKTLESKKAELDEQLKTADSKKEELLKYKEEIDEKNKELKKKEAELRKKKKELDAAKKKLDDGKKKISSGKKKIEKQKKTLASKKKSLNAKKKKVKAQLESLNKKEKELKEKKQSLQKAKNEIDKNLSALNDKEKSLKNTKNEAEKSLSLLKDLRESAVDLKEGVSSFYEFVRNSDSRSDMSEWLAEATKQLDHLTSDAKALIKLINSSKGDVDLMDLLKSSGISNEKLENIVVGLQKYSKSIEAHKDELERLIAKGGDPEEIETLRKTVVQETKEALDLITKENRITDAEFQEMIEKTDNLITEIEDGLDQVTDGLNEIAKAKKTLLKNQKDVDDGLSQIASGEQQIKKGKGTINDGLKKIDDGLSSIESGYDQINQYTREIEEEEKKLPSQEAKLAEYNSEYRKASKELSEAKKKLLSSEKEVTSGLQEIEGKTAQGKKELKSGEDKIKKSRKDAEKQRLEGLKQFEEVEAELNKAKEELDEWKGYGNFCNQFLMLFDSDADPDTTLAEARKALGEENIKNSYTYADSDVKNIIDINVDPLETMSIYVPLLFFIITLIVEFLFMSFLIRLCRREIGILRALGYSRNSIVALFCSVNLLSSGIAIIIGLIIGIGLTRYICTFFQGFFDLYFFNYEIHWKSLLASILLTILVGQISTIFSTTYVSRIQPSEAMSRPAPAASGTFERKLFSHLSLPPFFKYCIASLLRNKARLLFSIVCLSSSVILIVAAISFDFSKNEILNEQFVDRIHYDCEIFLSSEPDDEFIERLTTTVPVKNVEKVYYYTRDIEGNGVTEEKIIKAINPDTQQISIFNSQKKPMSVSDDGILLEKHTADPMGVTVGDTVLVDKTPMKIAGINDECENRTQYISTNSKETLGDPDMCTLVIDVNKEDETNLMEFLSKEENYIYTAFTTRVYNGFADGFNAFSVAAMIILTFAVIIGSVIVINTTSFNLQEQKKDLCILRTLGFQYSNLSIQLMAQSAVYYVCSCIIGIPCGIAVTKLLLEKMATDSRNYPLVNDFRVYLFTLLVVLAYITAGHFISMRAIKKWDLVETVKDKE